MAKQGGTQTGSAMRLYRMDSVDHYFPALYVLAVLLKLLAWISIPLGFIILAMMKPPGIGIEQMPGALLILTFVVSAASGFLLWAASDFIKLMLCLEHNTHRAAESKSERTG